MDLFKKNPISHLCVLLLGMCYALVTHAEIVREERDVSGFKAIEVSGAGTLKLTQGNSESLVIEADSDTLEEITTKVENGVLRIERKASSWFDFGSSEPIVFHLQFETLERLILSGSIQADAGLITTDQLSLRISGSGGLAIQELRSTNLETTVSGSGSFKADKLTADEITGRVSGSGSISIGGQVPTQHIRISGSGGYLAANLESDAVDARISGAGRAHVWANDNLDVRISGNGDLTYRGEPSLSKNLTGSGQVRSTD